MDDENIVHVGLVDENRAAQVYAIAGNDKINIDYVDYSEDELNSAFETAVNTLEKHDMLSGVSVQINEESNMVDVKVDSSKNSNQQTKQIYSNEENYTFSNVESAIDELESNLSIEKGDRGHIYNISYEDLPDEYTSSSCKDKFDCFPYLRGGLLIQNTGSMKGFECTIGFNARQGRNKYFLTAAHCGNMGDGFKQVGGGPQGRYIGHIDRRTDSSGDAARVKVIGPWKLTRWVYAKTRHVRPTGTEWQALKIEGVAKHNHSRRTLVCYSGVPSDYVCGHIITSRGTFPTESGVKTNFWLAAFPSQHGDSGGPVFLPGNRDMPNRVLAYGLISSFNPIRLFNHTVGPNILDVQDQMGAKVVTD